MDAAAAAQRARFPQLAKYELLEELGHGGMATVYRAKDKRLGRDVAVKVIHPHLRDSWEVVLRFHAEARAVAKLHHPNIVEVFDLSDPDEPEQYLVVELLRGTTLRKLLQAQHAIPPEVAAALALELLGALAHAHANGVVHRDIKPENVLIEPAAATSGAPREGVLVKLTDFGIAKLLDAQGVTSTGQVLGSPAHMAPEQIEGAEVDARADVFGLGVLLYECMVGHLPFEGSNPAQVLRRVLDGQYADAQRERPLIGGRWSALLDRALAHAPLDRFPDANAMVEAIRAEFDRLGISAPATELDAWLDNPKEYAEGHAKRMIEKLCALGSEERKRGDVLAAAADYNRALAHTPDDPQLLRVVAAMNRAEARTRLLRRGVGALVLMVGLAAVTFAVGRLVRAHLPSEAASLPGGAQIAIQAPPAIAPMLPAPSESAAPSASVSRRVAGPPATARESAAKPTERTITLHLEPAMGLKVSLDGEPPKDVSTGEAMRIDGRAHELVFACEVCGPPVHKLLAAADKDEALNVVVPVKPAILDVRGDPENTYQLVEEPQLVIRTGSNPVSLKSMFQSVTVRQMESDKRVKVRLKAGQTVAAVF